MLSSSIFALFLIGALHYLMAVQRIGGNLRAINSEKMGGNVRGLFHDSTLVFDFKH
jgi:hypothetical protein